MNGGDSSDSLQRKIDDALVGSLATETAGESGDQSYSRAELYQRTGLSMQRARTVKNKHPANLEPEQPGTITNRRVHAGGRRRWMRGRWTVGIQG